jgi:hypothetical protein
MFKGQTHASSFAIDININFQNHENGQGKERDKIRSGMLHLII